MNKYIAILTTIIGLSIGAAAQATGSKDVETKGIGSVNAANIQAVKIANTSAEPVPVKAVSDRKPFQVRISVAPTSNGFASAFLALPAGKRFIIENISAVGRYPEGLKMETNFFCYIDTNGDGVGDIADITFHRIALTEQGTFDGTTVASANHKVLVFADELIGTTHYGITLQARLNAVTTAFAQSQVTFSGYLEDIP